MFEEKYLAGDTPWDHGMVDKNLVDILRRHGIKPCRALDIGGGTGNNAVWLAQQGYDVTSCDLSATATERAHIKASDAQVDIRFFVLDFLEEPPPGAPFGFAFDRGCLHCMDTEEDRARFVQRVADLLECGGWWLCLAGNADEPKREIGPPRLTATELVSVVEPCFEIHSMESGHFGSDQESPPRAWICLLRKRGSF